ncbi:MAG: hypothetical protein IAI50_11855 [Candidatus Eremiobacteraeota bacterium]|nr:hypothetical protein [Candidatus Eremiobacteraeota bacterium]
MAFDDARLGACLGDLYGNDSFDAALLRARALLRLNRADAAVQELPAMTDVEAATHAQIAEGYVLRGAVLTRLSEFDNAHAAFAEAWVHVVSAGNAALEAEFEYYRALLAWMEGRFDDAAVTALVVEGVLEREELWLRPSVPYIVSLAATQARALELRAFEAGRVGKLHEQSRLLRRGLAVLRWDGHPDRFVEAGLLCNLAIVAREIGSVADSDAIAKRIAEIDWPADLTEQRYHIVRALGWCRALAGDHVGALRRFREAGKLAVTVAWQVFAVVDRAYLAVELGQQIFADEEIDHALELSLGVDWAKAGAEEAAALLMLAQLLAKRDSAEAALVFERYRAARKSASGLSFAALDPRLKASEEYARAHIALGRGASAEAAVLLAEAFSTWHRIGSKWRAALAASDLARLGVDERYARYAQREIAKRPQSWLALRFER